MNVISLSSLCSFLFVAQWSICYTFDTSRVIYAINAGGDVHVDSLGIKYEKDPLHNKVGVSSDYGKSLAIRRVPEKDFELYQVERYHHNSFGYDIPIIEDGDYVLVLKFCEVYFSSRNSKVFDVSLNGMRIIENLDIFDKVGKGVAHDEYIPFSIKDNAFVYNNLESFINNGKIKVEFLKGRKDNPKINAIIVYKGSIDDFPKLRSLTEEEKPYHQRNQRPSKPAFQQSTRVPYYSDDITAYWPILVAILSVFPFVFCLYYPKLPLIKPEEKIKFEYPEIKYNKNKKASSANKQQPPHDPYATEQPTMMLPVCFLMLGLFFVFYTFCRI